MTAPRPTLLLTRPSTASERLARQLPARLREKLRLCHSPVMQIVSCGNDLELGEARGLIFSSSNAVAITSPLTARRDLPCYCVGKTTAQAAAAAGWQAVACGGTADTLVADLVRRAPEAPLLHLRGTHTRGDIATRLTAAGYPTGSLVLYDQVLHPLSTEARAVIADAPVTPVIVPVFSPRTARHLAAQIPGTAGLHFAALSAAVAKPLENISETPVSIADQPDTASMVALIEKLVDRICRVEGGPGAQ